MVQESATVLQALFDLVLWAFIPLETKKAYYPLYTLKPSYRRIGIFLILLFCLFPFWGGDYFHYQQAFFVFNRGGGLNQEPVYGWIYSTFSFSYTVVRLCIWGCALFLLTRAYKICTPKFDLAIFLFGALYLHWYSYARASLAMSIILLGLALISSAKENRTLLYYFLGFALLGVSSFFHKSATIGIVAAIFSLFLLNAKKRTIFIVALSIPLIIYALQYALDYFAVMDLSEDTLITEHYRNRFVGGEEMANTGRFAFGPLLTKVFSRGPLYLIVVLYIVVITNGLYNKFTKGERAFASYAFIIVVMSIGFGFTEGYMTRVLQYRTLFFAMPASAIFLAAVHRNGYRKFPYQIVFWGAFVGSVYNMTYAVWCALVGQ